MQRESAVIRAHPLFLKNPNYALLWGGQLISSVGTQTSQLAFSLLALALTRSPAQASFISALMFVPYLFLALPAGAFIDRWNRKHMLLICNLGRGCCMASIMAALALHSLTIMQLALVALLDGIFFVFSNIGYTVSIPRVVSTEQLPVAAPQFDALDKISPLVGSVLGGILYSVQQFLPFLVDMLSYIFAILSLQLINVRFQDEQFFKPGSLSSEIRAGLIWFWRQPVLRYMVLFDAGIICTIAATSPLVIILLAQRQGASPPTIGLILACGGVGSVVGLTYAHRIQQRFRFVHVIIGIGCGWTLLWGCYALAPNSILLGLITFSIWALAPSYNAVQMTYRLRITPDALQGRINSIHRLVGYSFKLLSLSLTGILIQWLGLRPTLLLMVCWFALVALLTTVNLLSVAV